jgi:hypothetical protein
MKRLLRVVVTALSLIGTGEVFAQKQINKCEKKFTCPDRKFNVSQFIDATFSQRTAAEIHNLTDGTQRVICGYHLDLKIEGCDNVLASMTPEQYKCSFKAAQYLSYNTGGGNFGGYLWPQPGFHFFRTEELNVGGIDQKKCKAVGDSVVCNTCIEAAASDELPSSTIQEGIKDPLEVEGENEVAEPFKGR